jgi:hypothetical protein
VLSEKRDVFSDSPYGFNHPGSTDRFCDSLAMRASIRKSPFRFELTFGLSVRRAIRTRKALHVNVLSRTTLVLKRSSSFMSSGIGKQSLYSTHCKASRGRRGIPKNATVADSDPESEY